jgi:hypothetical protein
MTVPGSSPRKMAKASQRNRAANDARGDPSGPHHSCWDRPIGRDAICRAIIRGGLFPIDLGDSGEIKPPIHAYGRARPGDSQGARPGSSRDPDSLEHAVNLFFT